MDVWSKQQRHFIGFCITIGHNGDVKWDFSKWYTCCECVQLGCRVNTYSKYHISLGITELKSMCPELEVSRIKQAFAICKVCVIKIAKMKILGKICDCVIIF